MILEIDYGNTRLKWRLLDAKSLGCISRGAVIDLQELLPSLQMAGCLEVEFCRACSVRTVKENEQMSSLIQNNYGVEIEYAQSLEYTAGVTNGYLQAKKLGVDRWLAIVAAYTKVKHACVVIDCGTAITVDFISADGSHMGGCIAPGFKMLSTMLWRGTQLPVEADVTVYDDKMLLGNNTQAAVIAGVGAMFRGFIGEQLELAQVALGSSFSVLCTGGDSALVNSVTDAAVLEEDLVFVGLAIVCPYAAKE
ncbi:type III pantothenate kinase [Pseudomonas sp. C27(2019)]|uniref:type III pantothenate kinase n=1 Tax=Pseudomonas sp. C27(2019) TaxID=2604941 RepID=UPI001246F7D7|nr:type III pantothenate kinase [Pseudomonas sp. C27(2019)]QEY59824.1 type III pantothenate kinase [Pseudomonas sp. C27(2019)]